MNMAIILHVEPKTSPMSWKEFCEKSPPNSIALDGYVSEGPMFEHKGPRANFNHHEGCDRLATRSTCMQVLMGIRQGLFSTFTGKPHVYVNDCDEDVCTAVFLLKHCFLAKNINQVCLNKLVNLEDALDSTAGAYPFPIEMPALQELAWVFEPYRNFRLSSGLDRKSDKEFEAIIVDVEHRISQYIAGHGDAIPLDTRYEILMPFPKWQMIKEVGANARTGFFADGYKAYVSVRERNDGRYTYVLGKLAFAKFPIPILCVRLNEAEAIKMEPKKPTEYWGGGTTIIGSPRINGSALTPIEVANIVNDTIKEQNE